MSGLTARMSELRKHRQNHLIIGLMLFLSLWCSVSVSIAQENKSLQLTVQEYELPPLALNSIVHVVAWSPDGKYLAIGSNITIRLYVADTLESIAQLEGHTAGNTIGKGITALAWSPNSDRLASASRDKTIRIWDVTTGTAVIVDGEFEHTITSIAWRPDGELLASTSLDLVSVKLINPFTGQVENIIHFTDSYGLPTASTSVAWSPDQRSLVVCGARDLQIFEVDKQGVTLGVSKRDTLGPSYIARWSPDGSMIAVDNGPTLSPSPGTYNHTFTGSVWDATTGDLIQLLEGLSSEVVALAWSPDGRFLAANSRDWHGTGGDKSSTHIWEVGTWQTVAVLENGLVRAGGIWPTDYAYTLAWSPDSHQLATVGNDNLLRIWTLEGGD